MKADSKTRFLKHAPGFTLVEMLIVIVIMSILMTAGAIGLSGMGGKGVSSGAATVESLFDEARSIAIGQRTRARVLVAMDLTNNPADNLRRIVVVSEELNTDGTPKTGSWVISSRGIVLPDQVFFSKTYSMSDQSKLLGFGATSEMSLASPTFKAAFAGKYLFYEFNAEGVCTTPGASFVLGSGSRGLTGANQKGLPKATAAGLRDFGGFVVWRNGRTSTFRSPEQISTGIKSMKPGDQF